MKLSIEVKSQAQFINRLVTACLCHGYRFYTPGQIPQAKDPGLVDAKLIEKYAITSSQPKRTRRKQRGLANLQLFRYESFFVLIATRGEHPFFQEERRVFDIGKRPLLFAGHSIALEEGRPHVSIARKEYSLLRHYLLDLAAHRRRDFLEDQIRSLPYCRYAPVLVQQRKLVDAINLKRKKAGFQRLSVKCAA